MSSRVFLITDTSPASASTAVGSSVSGLSEFANIRIDADLLGGTGGVLDVYLQRLVAPGYWTDWIHFPQLSAATAARYSAIASAGISTTISVANKGSDAVPALSALAANTFLGGHPGQTVRAVYVAGASTSAGAVNSIYLTGFGPLR